MPLMKVKWVQSAGQILQEPKDGMVNTDLIATIVPTYYFNDKPALEVRFPGGPSIVCLGTLENFLPNRQGGEWERGRERNEG